MNATLMIDQFGLILGTLNDNASADAPVGPAKAIHDLLAGFEQRVAELGKLRTSREGVAQWLDQLAMKAAADIDRIGASRAAPSSSMAPRDRGISEHNVVRAKQVLAEKVLEARTRRR